MFAPLVLLRRADLAGMRTAGRTWLVYFGSLGVGFIVVEMVLIQQFILFLGHPIYAVTVVVFGMLASSSLGSLASGRFATPGLGRRLVGVLGGVVALLVLAFASLAPATQAVFDAPLSVRIATAFALIAPAGFLMGMPFPTGIRLLSRDAETAVPWMWGLNGAASVLGTVFAACFSIYLGLSFTYLIGAGFYALALAAALLAVRSVRTPAAD